MIAPEQVSTRLTPLVSHPQQDALYRDPHRFKIVVAGRRSGKTEIAKRWLYRCLFTERWVPWEERFRYLPNAWFDGVRMVKLPPPYHFAYCSPTAAQARAIAWDHMKEMFLSSHVRQVSESRLQISTIYDTHLHIVGMDKPQRLEGRILDGAVVDEMSDQKPGMYDRTVRPAVADRSGWAWRIGVPKRHGPGAQDFKEAYKLGSSGEDPDTKSYHWDSSTVLSEAELRSAQNTMDPKTYREQFKAAWIGEGGSAFYAFSEEQNVRPCTYHPENQVIVGCDFNVDPMAWVLCHRYSMDNVEWLEVFDEIWLRDSNTRHALRVLSQRYAMHKGGWRFIGDASSHHRQTSAPTTDYVLIKNHEFFKALCDFPGDNPPVRDRLNSCNTLLGTESGLRRCFIDPNCRHLIDDFLNRTLEKDGLPSDSKTRSRKSEDQTDIGHISDAWGYIVHFLFPLRLKAQESGSGKVKIGIFRR